MPYYDFICYDCDDYFEAKKSFAEANTPANCPTCLGENTKKQLTRINVLAGSGASPQKSKTPMPLPSRQIPVCGGGGCACHGPGPSR